MTKPLFNKIACFTDLHIGLKNHSIQHNEDCLAYVQWFIEQAKSHNVDCVAFLGDWHHSRHSIKIDSLNYTMRCLELLNSAFDRIYFITGNHDLFHKESRQINSLIMAKHLSNFILVQDVIHEGDVVFAPWLVGNEWKQISKIKAKYFFGHLELGGFLMNGLVEMPDHGGLNIESFKNYDYAFSGHFHKRQTKGNVVYMGNCFPHDFSDTWDNERGMMILEWGGKPEYINWPNAPKYRTFRFSELLENPTKYLDQNTYARITLDLELTFEETSFLKETLIKQIGAREFSIIASHEQDDDYEFDENVKFESVDQIVINGLNNIDSSAYDTELMIEIYRSL